MKKLFCIISAILMVAAMFFGCSNKNDNDNSNATSSSNTTNASTTTTASTLNNNGAVTDKDGIIEDSSNATSNSDTNSQNSRSIEIYDDTNSNADSTNSAITR